MLHVHVDATCQYQCCMSISVVHVHVDAEYPCLPHFSQCHSTYNGCTAQFLDECLSARLYLCCSSISTLHVHVRTACSCQCCMPLSQCCNPMLYPYSMYDLPAYTTCLSMLYVRPACPCLYAACTSWLSLLYVRAAFPSCMFILDVPAVQYFHCKSMLHFRYMAFYMSMLPVFMVPVCFHALCPFCMSMFHVHFAGPYACPHRMSMLYMYVHVNTVTDHDLIWKLVDSVHYGRAVFGGNLTPIGSKLSSGQCSEFLQFLTLK